MVFASLLHSLAALQTGATLLAWVAEASSVIKSTADQIAEHLRAAPVLNADESVLCNAHLLRERLYVKESTGPQSPESMMQLLLGAHRICTAAR